MEIPCAVRSLAAFKPDIPAPITIAVLEDDAPPEFADGVVTLEEMLPVPPPEQALKIKPLAVS